MKAGLIDVVEKKIEQIYDNYQLTPELRKYLEKYLQKIILKERLGAWWIELHKNIPGT